MKRPNVLVTGERLPAARKDELDLCEYFNHEANKVTRGETSMRVGIATDPGGFGLKQELIAQLRAAGHEVVDFGAHSLMPDDDYPDFVIPLTEAVVAGKVERGMAICGSGVGAAVMAAAAIALASVATFLDTELRAREIGWNAWVYGGGPDGARRETP